ncbi:hypothetical protein ASE85_03340 [Sphingobium sp. Leaf26]|uniref:hypothetical protein n=1 Tax=Sphingobium sp. Leaf26 TaxID=1735693 RepID=UPI0006FCB520|nr:hypothetical protein [Sphingobium sp. Leaf26]KQN09978.1 hypothetical protein ASE85_03340 [Sphingobium sp. Leaf26]
MRIDNDFLTLMHWVIRIELLEQKIAGADTLGDLRQLDRELHNRVAERDALVAKINAADDADAAVEKQTVALVKSTKKTNDTLAKVLEAMDAIDPAPAQAGAQRANEILEELNAHAQKHIDQIKQQLLTDALEEMPSLPPLLRPAIDADSLARNEARIIEANRWIKDIQADHQPKDAAPAPSQPKGFTINGLGQMTEEWVHSPSADELGTFEAIVGERPKSGCTYQIITDRKRAQEAVFERALELGFAVHISRTKLGSYLLRWDDVGEGR